MQVVMDPMSYLEGPRISFTGRFFGDVPTINNSPSSYQPSGSPVPAWNPGGGATFDFLDCRVSGGEGGSGAPMAAGDPVRGLSVVGAADRTSAKLVDLDPAWQRSSQIWGLVVRLVDPASGEELLSGSFRVSAFRDLWIRQIGQEEISGQPSGGSFSSVLEDVAYGPGAAASPVLSALRRAAPAPRLSIVLNMFGYFYRHVAGRFATGSLTGCIGPWRPGEPDTFVAGRRLGPGLVHALAPPAPRVLLGASVAFLDPRAPRLVIDLGNAYPVADYDGRPASLADLSSPNETVSALEVGLLDDEAVAANVLLDAGTATVLGTIDLSQAPSRAGVYTFPLDPATAERAAGRPLALLVRRPDGTHRVICRETTDGLYVRADEFVHRIDAGRKEVAKFYAVQRGEPAPGVAIRLKRRDRPTEPALEFRKRVVTGAGGTADVELSARDPGSPRGAIDGVVEEIEYAPRTTGGRPDYAGTGLSPGLDVVVVHVRSAYQAPEVPDWARDIQPILAQYARLYPIMREHLVDLADPDALRRWREPLLLAMTRDIADPNFMPVTRDLSEAKRAAIVRWLEHLPAVDHSGPSVDAGLRMPAAPVPAGEDRFSADAKQMAAEATGRRLASNPAPPAGDDER
jgi:hypothetical protein